MSDTIAIFELNDYEPNMTCVIIPSVEAAQAWCKLWGHHSLLAVGEMSHTFQEPISWDEWTVEHGGFHSNTHGINGKDVPAALAEYIPAVLARSELRIAEQIKGTYAYRIRGLEPICVEARRQNHRRDTREYLRRLISDLRAARLVSALYTELSA